jgi:hypothetical protein
MEEGEVLTLYTVSLWYKLLASYKIVIFFAVAAIVAVTILIPLIILRMRQSMDNNKQTGKGCQGG